MYCTSERLPLILENLVSLQQLQQHDVPSNLVSLQQLQQHDVDAPSVAASDVLPVKQRDVYLAPQHRYPCSAAAEISREGKWLGDDHPATFSTLKLLKPSSFKF
jgi:hypothetical protein